MAGMRLTDKRQTEIHLNLAERRGTYTATNSLPSGRYVFADPAKVLKPKWDSFLDACELNEIPEQPWRPLVFVFMGNKVAVCRTAQKIGTFNMNLKGRLHGKIPIGIGFLAALPVGIADRPVGVVEVKSFIPAYRAGIIELGDYQVNTN
jgi:hypothetical protein